MDDNALLYFSRQLLVNRFAFTGQEKLLNSTVLIVGAGGLGCSVAMALAGSGVGSLILVDDDLIEVSNLARQQLFTGNDIGQAKSVTACNRLREQFPHSEFTAVNKRFNKPLFNEQLANTSIDLLIDAGDNLALTHLLAELADEYNIPLIHASVIRFEGFVYAYLPKVNFPNAKVLFPDNSSQETCSEQGVLTVAVSLVANLQAVQAIRVLTTPETVRPELLLFDGHRFEFRAVKV